MDTEKPIPSANELPIYFVPAATPWLKQMDELFATITSPDYTHLTLTLIVDDILNGKVASAQHVVLAIQHQPHLIEKCILNVEIKVTDVPGSDLFLPSTYWEDPVPYYTWFNKLIGFPAALFFLADENHRWYALAGDMLATDLLVGKTADKYGKVDFALSDDNLLKVMQRLFDSCWYLLVFCYGSGFNPQMYIESVLADLGLPLTYEEVNKQFLEDLKEGISFSNYKRDE